MKMPQVLFVVFVVLKLTGYIDWSWWWVTSPIWVTFTLALIYFTWDEVKRIKRANRPFARYRK